MPVSYETFERVALEDPEGMWELHCGALRQKPEMTAEHNHIGRTLAFDLQLQLNRRDYEVSWNAGYVRRQNMLAYIADVIVIPVPLLTPQRAVTDRLESYTDPLPLVVEVWSRSTGDYDISDKVPEYMRRGDAEIWHIHPYEQTLTAWRRQPDGSYSESVYTTGVIELAALPSVRINLEELFA